VLQRARDAEPLLLAERQHAVPMRLLLDPGLMDLKRKKRSLPERGRNVGSLDILAAIR